MPFSKKCSAPFLISALALCVGPAMRAGADTIVNTAYTGTPGANGSVDNGTYIQGYDNDAMFHDAGVGGDAYTTASTGTYLFTNTAVIAGGLGGSIFPTETAPFANDIYYAAEGGYAISDYNSSLNFAGGTYTGGNGGSIAGTANQAAAGAGNDALFALFGTVQINSGTFVGGSAGTYAAVANMAAPFTSGGGSAVDAVLSTVTIAGGSFTAGAASPGVAMSQPGDSVLADGTVSIMGGTFSGLIYESGHTLTIYGSNFQINGSPAPYGQVSVTSGTLTGLLQNNSTASSLPFLVSGGTFTLAAPVPEPVSGGLLMIACSLGLAKRRRVS